MLKWIIVLLIILIVLGAGKLPKVMGDLGKGFKNFKKEIDGTEREDEAPEAPRTEGKTIDVKAERKDK